MPTYTYTCTACNDLIEKRQSFSDPPLTTCEQCGGALRKVIHPVGIVFKGSGWYITDSRSSTASANGRTGSSSSEGDSSSKASESGTPKDSAPSTPTTSTTTPSSTKSD
ncbi:MAG: FmdB family transcriptional regulator [Chloroflexi bacterium]|nr:FmdB family transcriptional regulator [Chloroflexota bacterium]MBV9892740.1 FmdB family transcriptional regulator [Chloroflexota bacterium]